MACSTTELSAVCLPFHQCYRTISPGCSVRKLLVQRRTRKEIIHHCESRRWPRKRQSDRGCNSGSGWGEANCGQIKWVCLPCCGLAGEVIFGIPNLNDRDIFTSNITKIRHRHHRLSFSSRCSVRALAFRTSQQPGHEFQCLIDSMMQSFLLGRVLWSRRQTCRPVSEGTGGNGARSLYRPPTQRLTQLI